MNPDDVLNATGSSIGLGLHLLEGDVSLHESPMLVISGSRESLRIFAHTVLALADRPELPASFHLDPRGAGNFHLTDESDAGVYLECLPADS